LFWRQILLSVGFIAGLNVPVGAQSLPELSKPTKDAMLHVLAHEIGHAFLREFDLPIMGPEEDIADDFATVYIHLTWPDRAADIIGARARQNMLDGGEAIMFSEYRSDDQRAGRSVCVLYGQDPERYSDFAAEFGLEGEEADACRDFGPEVGRSWRRLIAQYTMPEGARVTEVGINGADTPYAQAARSMTDDAYTLLAGIDWHSRVTLVFDDCNGSAGWARGARRITICDAYLERFEAQLAE